MKTVKILLLIALIFSTANTADAQIKDWLNKKKQEAKEKVNNKIDQKSSQGIDKAIDAPETAVKKQKEKKKNKSDQTREQADGTNIENTPTETTVPTDEGVITTNINCKEGKLKVEELLRDMDGVNGATIDTDTGKVYLSARGDKEIYNAAVELICKNGFKANGKKATTKANACK